jgi:hypothetical protein
MMSSSRRLCAWQALPDGRRDSFAAPNSGRRHLAGHAGSF